MFHHFLTILNENSTFFSSVTMSKASGKSEAMESLIPLVNDLQDIFNGLGFQPIELPQICVRYPPRIFHPRPITLYDVIHPRTTSISDLGSVTYRSTS